MRLESKREKEKTFKKQHNLGYQEQKERRKQFIEKVKKTANRKRNRDTNNKKCGTSRIEREKNALDRNSNTQ